MSLLNHLNTHFYRTEELCQALKVDTEQLTHWQESGLFPKPSYSIQNQIKCSSFLGLYECEEFTDYYPRGCVQWGLDLIKHKVSNAAQAYELFFQHYTQSLKKCQQQGLHCQDERFSDDLCEQIQNAWQQYLCSKYGVISQNGLVEELVHIELGRAIVDEITEERSTASINAQHRPALLHALKLLNRAFSHPAKHERNHSLRERYIDALVCKYDLSIK
ncbi:MULTISPECIES: DUF6058 family natural product biosynthesis protein [Pseudoalteromonas]|uniref:Orphan protein n=1 Tax=Pseudoalteromonas amylolytica TaxID=1859457 RepID=A0A1S1N035_9GAMM|nr:MULTISPECIES: DUF6058 family natural product biosynthesis protein [Pseudoalteromonas]OHU85376.1 hypothetical protein BFC16_18660 [Pseudoalteromonas sp. JW3]OHU93003.1 hypothetical protein BET10_03055 [Pseudoalteromonas amylolytica]